MSSAVVDTGVAYENYTQGWWFRRSYYYLAPDLASTRFLPGYDFINNDTHANDDEGHGTHVAGTIAQSSDYAHAKGVTLVCATGNDGGQVPYPAA